MKLLGLQVERLYGHYNYDKIIFNSDVTFIYGLNGCGKTTILNITEAIITGQIYKLFSYDFYKIKLQYASKDNFENIFEIIIIRDGEKITTIFQGKEYIIEKKEVTMEERSFDISSRYYFSKYIFLLEIKKTFNYVYLPLNRSVAINDMDMEDNLFLYRRNRLIDVEDDFYETLGKDPAMIQVERLIRESFNKINSNISHINDKFRNDILKSLLDVKEYADSKKVIDEIFKQVGNASSIEETKKAYIKILKDLSLINQEEETNFTRFFDEVYNYINENNEKITAEEAIKIYEVVKIKKIVSLAEETEKRKANIREPIEKFIKTMNEFINAGDDGKRIEIDLMGRVHFKPRFSDKNINIQYLSSGEKQLLTFFANLIFKVKNNKSGIFVVDEPELSLHLFWQKIFVEKTLEINKNMQLIFATHAPEIIGRRREKMFKLEKKYVG